MPMSPRLLRPRASGLVLPSDADARAYVQAVNTADGQPLEAPVVQAIDAFVIGCKADGIWSAIKASCILMGARTLSGALTPLVGSAPTNNNFVSGDYNRKTGLAGNASTKHLNSNRAGNADPQNSFHMSCYNTTAHDPGATSPFGTGGANIGNGDAATTGANNIGIGGGPDLTTFKTFARSRNSTADALIGPVRTSIVFQGMSRANESSYTVRVGGADYSQTRASQSPSATNLFVFARNSAGTVDLPGNSRLAFYSIGESLTLSLLDSRVTTLYNAIGAAIP